MNMTSAANSPTQLADEKHSFFLPKGTFTQILVILWI